MRGRDFLLLIALFCTVQSFAQVIDLDGDWKFHIGDDPDWSKSSVDDSHWESMYAPGPWEEQGFNGYDGFAWYRRKFDGRKLDANGNYYLGLGFIDDCDEVFVNGMLIGFSGKMPPKFKTAFNNERKYNLPPNVINFKGQNTIAIRIFDITQGGGIIQGNLGIFRSKKNSLLLVDLQGVWSFAMTNRQADKPEEDAWDRILVPSAWEFGGHYKYDGYAWYRRSFTLPATYSGEALILLLGKIDDFDITYVNGRKIGVTNDHHSLGHSGSYQELRAYPIPSDLLSRTGSNTIEVFVEDMGNIGGIYEGPVGIVTKANYVRFENR